MRAESAVLQWPTQREDAFFSRILMSTTDVCLPPPSNRFGKWIRGSALSKSHLCRPASLFDAHNYRSTSDEGLRQPCVINTALPHPAYLLALVFHAYLPNGARHFQGLQGRSNDPDRLKDKSDI